MVWSRSFSSNEMTCRPIPRVMELCSERVKDDWTVDRPEITGRAVSGRILFPLKSYSIKLCSITTYIRRPQNPADASWRRSQAWTAEAAVLCYRECC